MLTACMSAFGLSGATTSQTSSPNQIQEMRKLDFLVGEWKGEGWELNPDGSRSNRYSQKTKVEAKESNSTLRIKDSKTYKPVISDGKIFARGTPVYHSSTLEANIYYDDTSKLFHWRAAFGRRNPLEAKLIREKALQYGMPFSITLQPADGNRRTTIEVAESGEWHETLEVWQTDKWYKVEEAILKRVK